jgi:hypothetical protein
MMTIVGVGLLWQSKEKENQLASPETARPTNEPRRLVANSPASAVAAQPLVETEKYQIPQIEKLHNFQRIQDKVFQSSEEEILRKSLIKDRSLIEDMGAFLLDPRRFAKLDSVAAKELEKDQDSAVDFLLAALKEGDRDFAESTILNVIKDAQVENSALQMDQREVLASLKGELLFHGSAIRPASFQNIASILPGPVSLRIWQNVQAKQAQYLEESMVEKVAHDSKY